MRCKTGPDDHWKLGLPWANEAKSGKRKERKVRDNKTMMITRIRSLDDGDYVNFSCASTPLMGECRLLLDNVRLSAQQQKQQQRQKQRRH